MVNERDPGRNEKIVKQDGNQAVKAGATGVTKNVAYHSVGLACLNGHSASGWGV